MLCLLYPQKNLQHFDFLSTFLRGAHTEKNSAGLVKVNYAKWQ